MMASGDILKVDPTGFPDMLGIEYERDQGRVWG